MLFTIERYVIRVGSRCLRRCFSKSVVCESKTSTDSTQEFISQPDNFTFVRREDRKLLKIAILGAPNAGKSTLVNKLIKRSICPTSAKVHTTLTKASAIYCEDNTQLVFIDTPGMVTETECKRYNLSNSFRHDPKVSLAAADIAGIVQDAQNIYTRNKINPNILKLLTENKMKEIPLILILNKVDKVKKKQALLELVYILTNKQPLKFDDIFMISALTGDGVDDLRTYLLDSAKPQDWQYEEHVYSDHKCEDIIQQTVRAKLMDILPEEIPYALKVKLDHFNPGPEDSIVAIVSVKTSKKRIARLLIRGNKKLLGNRVKQVAVMAEQELRNAFRTPVKLSLNIEHSLT